MDSGTEAPRSHHDDIGKNDGLGQEFDPIAKSLYPIKTDAYRKE